MPIVYFVVANISTNQQKKQKGCCQKKPTATGKGTKIIEYRDLIFSKWKSERTMQPSEVNNERIWNIFLKQSGCQKNSSAAIAEF